MNAIAIISMLALLTEALIEYVLPFSFPDNWKWLKNYIAIAVAVVVCLAYHADLLAALGIGGGVPYIGSILTGVLISRGANIFNLLISRLGVVTAPAQPIDSVVPVEPVVPIEPAVPLPMTTGSSGSTVTTVTVTPHRVRHTPKEDV